MTHIKMLRRTASRKNEIQTVLQVESSLNSRGNGISRDILFTFLRAFSQNQFQTLNAYAVLKLS